MDTKPGIPNMGLEPPTAEEQNDRPVVGQTNEPTGSRRQTSMRILKLYLF